MSSTQSKRPQSNDKDVSPPPKRRLVATTNSQAVANFFTPASQKPPEKTKFQVVHDTVLVARHGETVNKRDAKPIRFAAFDLDDTLITRQSGLRFARDANDWRWWDPSVPSRLRELHDSGFIIVVISNQGSVMLQPPKGKSSVFVSKSRGTFQTKVAAILNAIDLPISLYAATGLDNFRKPRAGLWAQILGDHGIQDNDADVDYSESFYVGDAAGRPADVERKIGKDHACSDRDFAANAGLRFLTPEEMFRGENARAYERSFDPLAYMHESESIMYDRRHDKELVLFCGSPGAGKSSFYWRYLEPLGYERVNQDILKTRDKCLKTAAKFLEEGKSVAVDNTNADVDTRAAWVALARTHKVPVRLVHFTASAKLCEHNDTVRALAGALMNPESRMLLPRMAFSGFASRYRPPQLDEGFEEITKVDFKFNGTEEQRALWRKYWIS